MWITTITAIRNHQSHSALHGTQYLTEYLLNATAIKYHYISLHVSTHLQHTKWYMWKMMDGWMDFRPLSNVCGHRGNQTNKWGASPSGSATNDACSCCRHPTVDLDSKILKPFDFGAAITNSNGGLTPFTLCLKPTPRPTEGHNKSQPAELCQLHTDGTKAETLRSSAGQ